MIPLGDAAGRLLLTAACLASISAGAACLASESARAAGLPEAELISDLELMGPAIQAMQADDTANPGMLWVGEGEALWRQPAGRSGRACADCHGEASTSMHGVAARYPAFDEGEGRPVDLPTRVNLCRSRHQAAEPLAHESEGLLSLTGYLGFQSRGLPASPDPDPRLEPFRERGRQLFEQRLGQLDFACSQCHDDHWGGRLAGSVIPQGHPTGYPIYRLEWQAVGSLQRRFRNCMTGVRAEPYPFGALEFIELELYLMERARGLPIETPAVRP
jgi:L-cysteine S-thiosulfotransferase